MKVYVAGKWSNKDRLVQLMDRLRGLGIEITHDWTKNEKTTGSPEQLGNFAKLDTNGVKNADLMIAVLDDPSYPYRGTFTELGVALGCGTRIFIYCPDDEFYCVSNCFFHHPDIVRFYDLDLLVNEVKKNLE